MDLTAPSKDWDGDVGGVVSDHSDDVLEFLSNSAENSEEEAEEEENEVDEELEHASDSEMRSLGGNGDREGDMMNR